MQFLHSSCSGVRYSVLACFTFFDWLCCHMMINTVLLRAGCRCESEKHRQGIRHEDPQQMGDAEASWGEHHSLVAKSFIWSHWTPIAAVQFKLLERLMMGEKKKCLLSGETTAIKPTSNQAFIDECLQNMLLLELHELRAFHIDLFLTVWHSCWSPGSSIFMPHTSKAKNWSRLSVCVQTPWHGKWRRATDVL